MYRLTSILFFCTLLCASCRINDTEVLYTSKQYNPPKRLAFTQLSGDVSTHNRFDKTDAFYIKAMQYALKPYKLDSLQYIDCCLDFNNQSSEEIKRICDQNHVDGVLIAQLKFETLKNCGKLKLPDSEFETEVEVKLYGADGKLKMHTLHNTIKMQSYRVPPQPILAIKDGVSSAVRKLAKGVNLEHLP